MVANRLDQLVDGSPPMTCHRAGRMVRECRSDNLRRIMFWFGLAAVAFPVALLGSGGGHCASVPRLAAATPREPLTFNRDVAPIIFARCAPCHRPDQAAPFPLLSYS